MPKVKRKVEAVPAHPPGTAGGEAPEGGIRAVLRALAVLECFEAQRPHLTLQALVDRLGLPKTTVFRLVQTLLAAGWLVQKENQEFSLSFRLLQLGSVVQGTLGVLDVARPEMLALAERTGETVEMSLRTGPCERTCVEVVESRQALKSIVRVGERIPFEAGATSKVFLAHLSPTELDQAFRDGTGGLAARREALLRELPRIRRQGFAATHGERVPGASAVSVPIFGLSGRHEYCLTVLGPSARFRARLDEFRHEALRAGRVISARLGHRGEPE